MKLRKWTAILLTMCMLFGMLPGAAFAEGEQPPATETVQEETKEKVEENSEEKTEEKTEESSEEKTEEKSEESSEEKTEEKSEEKSEESSEEKSEEKTEEKSEEDPEEKAEDEEQEKAPEEQPVVKKMLKVAAEPRTAAEDLQTEINEAADGVETTITLTADVEDIPTAIRIPEEKIIILDMAGHKITVNSSFSGRAIENAGDLTVQGNGTIDASNSSNGYGAINNTGTLTIENGTFRGNSEANASNIRNYGKDAVLVINDGTFDTSSTAVLNYDGTATLNGGTYTTHDHNCSTCGSNWSYVVRTYTDGEEGVYPRLYVNGGTYTGTQGALSSSTGYLEVNGGTFKTVPCAEGHTAVFYALYAAGEYGDVQCIINGGTFETVGTVSGRPAVLIGNDNTNGDGGINADALSHIYGGTFIAPDGIPAVGVSPNTAKASVIHGGTYTLLTADAQAYVDPVMKVTEGAETTTVTKRTENDEDAVAKVGEDVYASLQAAINAATAGKTVTLVKDTSVDRANEVYGVKVWNDRDITLDLNGKTLDGAIWNYGTLTITGNGTINNAGNGYGWPAVENWDPTAKLTIEDGTFVGSSDNALLNARGATATIKGGTYKGGFGSVLSFNNATMTIYNGMFPNGVRNGLTDDADPSVMTIYDGKFGSENAAVGLGNGKGTVKVHGGTFCGTYHAAENLSTMVVENGTFQMAEGHDGPGFVNEGAAAELTIRGGTFTGYCPENAVNKISFAGLQLLEGAVVHIEDGTFKGMDGAIYCMPEATNKFISGGTFSSDVSAYVVEGSRAVTSDNATWTIAPKEDSVAAIGSKGYDTLGKAIAAAKAGDIVTVLKDIPDSRRVTINGSVAFTIDLNGKTVGGGDQFATIMLNNKNAKVEIKNGTLSDTNAARGTVYVQQGEVTLTNVTVNASTRGVGIGPGVQNYCGKATLNAGTVITATESGVGIFGDNTTNAACVSELVVNEGVTITSQLYGIAGNGLNDNTVITINGGTVTATGGHSSAPEYSAGIYHPQQGTLNIKGGTISGKVGVQMAGGKAVIEGGTLRSTDTDTVEVPYKAAQQGDGMVLDGAALSLVSRSAYGDIDVVVTGGTFEIANPANEAVKKYGMQKTAEGWEIIDEPTTSKLAISGGTFVTAVPVGYCAEGYVPVRDGETYGVTDTLTITPNRTTQSGAGAVILTVAEELTVGSDEITVTCDDETVTVTRNEDGTFTTSRLPNTTRTYTFTATVGSKTASCTVAVTRYVSGGGGGGGTTTTRPTQPEENIDEPDVPLAQPLPFIDVEEKDWFYDAVRYVFDKDMIKGTNDEGTVFDPGMTTTRGMIVTILHRLEGTPEAVAAAYPDVADGAWYTDAVNWGTANDVVKGLGDGTFRPEEIITREQLAVILSRYATFKGYDKTARGDLSQFGDSDQISDWAKEDMTWAVGVGLLEGRGDGVLDPLGTTTRAEAAQMLKNFCEKVENSASDKK